MPTSDSRVAVSRAASTDRRAFGAAQRGWDAATPSESPGVVQTRLGHEFGRIAVHPPATDDKGRPGRLPHALRTGIERLAGVPMHDVTVHTDSPQPARFRALAYARGTEIHLGPGQERHLAHEAWHVVQQKQRRVRPTLRTRGAPVNDDPALETEASVMGARSLRAPGPDGAGARPVQDAQAGLGAEAPVQLLVGATRFNWGIWARGGGNVDSNQHLAGIHDALGRYHPGQQEHESPQDFSDRRARALDDAQRGVHRYLGAMGDLQHGGLPRDYMLGLADDLQQAQVDHVDHVHRNDLRLYSGENLNHADRQQLDADWDEVRNGAGAVRLPQDPEHEADNRVTRASFARLMSRPQGRGLVRSLLQPPAGPDAQPWRIDVGYTPRLSAKEQGRREEARRAFAPLAAASTAATLAARQPNATQADHEEANRRQEALMPFLDQSRRDYRSMEADEPAAASRAPHGATLRVLSGLKDSENLNHRQPNAGLIAASSHIILGHELVHALHYKTGQNPAAPPANYEYGQPLAHWGNPEEHDTIAQGPGPTENLLRAEHAMPARAGHTAKRRDELDAEERARRVRAGVRAGVGVGAAAATGYGLYRYLRR